MRFTPLVLIAAAALAGYPSTAKADEASKSAKAAELMQIAMGDNMERALVPMLKQLVDTLGQDLPAEKRAKLAGIQEKSGAISMAAFQKVKPELSKAYADTFTEAELDGILAFYRSTAGKALLQKQPEAQARTAPVMTQLLNDVKSQVEAAMAGIQ